MFIDFTESKYFFSMPHVITDWEEEPKDSPLFYEWTPAVEQDNGKYSKRMINALKDMETMSRVHKTDSLFNYADMAKVRRLRIKVVKNEG